MRTSGGFRWRRAGRRHIVGAAVVALAVVSVLAFGTSSGGFSERQHSAAPAVTSSTHALSHALARSSRTTHGAQHSSPSSEPSLSRGHGASVAGSPASRLAGSRAPSSRPAGRLLAALTGCGASNTIADKTGFEDNDGNLKVDQAGCVDWNSFAPLTWSGTAPYQTATSSSVPPFTFYGRTDATNSGSDTTFANGASGKESVNCPATGTGSVPNKDDLARIYIAGAQSINGDTYLYLAWVRAPQNTPNSDLHVAFELNQSSVACANGDGLVQRTDGDLLIGYEFQSSTPTLTLSTWSGGAWSAPVTLTSANSEGGVWTSVGTTPDALKPAGAPDPAQDEFGEAGIDLTQAVKNLGGGRPCETFGTVYGASRTSGQSSTADMKDLVGPQPFVLSNCASPTITTQATPTTINLGETQDISDTATLHDGNAPTGNVDFTLYSDASCKNAVAGVSGSGAISNVGGSYQASYTKTAWMPTAAGTYYWGVSYAGDGNNNPFSACGGANEEIVVTQPVISITKTADASPVSAGQQIGFTVEVKNTGSGAATGVSLSDPLPAGSGAGVTWVVDTSVGTPSQFVLSGVKGSQTLSLASSTLPAGADYTVHIVAQTSASECSVYDNTATLTAANATSPGPASAREVCNSPHIHIVKTADAAQVSAGDPIGFTLTVYNDGPGDATGVQLSDPLPNTPGLSWSVASQGAGWGGSCSIAGGVLSCGGASGVTVPAGTTQAASTFTVHIVSSTTSATGGTCPGTGDVKNTGTVTAGNGGRGQSTASTCVAAPAIHIVKTADAAQVSAGDPIGFTLTVYNDGPGDATGVQLSDPLPGNTGLSWSVASQGAGWGGSCSIAGGVLSCGGAGGVTVPAGTTLAGSTFTVHIVSSTTSATGGTCPGTGDVKNTGTVTAGNGGRDQSTASTCVAAPGIHIVKTADQAQVPAGSPIGFTLTVYNDGPGDATGVQLSDPLPNTPGLSWSIASQGAGWGGSCSIAGGVLSCGGTSGVTVPAGTTLAGSTFTVHVTSPTTSATGGGCPGGSGVVDNTGTVTAGNGGADQATASTCVAGPAIHIVKTADGAQVSAGDPIGFTLTVYNDGVGDATGVKLSDTLPSKSGLSWTIASQGAGWGGSCSIAGGVLSCGGASGVTVPAGTTLAGSTFTVHVTSPTTSATGGGCPGGSGLVDNTGTVTAGNGGTDQSSASTCVSTPGIHILKTPDAAQVSAGSQIGFTLTVYNDGAGDAHGVMLSDPLPANAGLSWSIASQGAGWGGSCSIAGGVLSCGGAGGVTVPAGTAAAGSTFTVHIVSPTTSATGGTCPGGSGVVDNTGSVFAGNGGSDQATGVTCVQQNLVDLAITKVGRPSPDTFPGNITWTLVVTNNGPATDTGVTVADPVPAGNSFVAVSTTQGSCTGGSVVSCSLGTMANGASVTIILVTKPSVTGNVTNTGTVVGNNPETNTANNTATATVLVVGPHKPPVQYCTAVVVRPKQLYTGRKTKLHLKVTRHGKAVKGVRVRIKGPHVNMVTKRSNRKGAIVQALRPKRAGIIVFRPVATKSCKTPRVGVTDIFTPPVTG